MNNMVFNSIFSGDITVTGICVMMGMAVVLGILTALVFSFRTFQSQSFFVTLVLIPLVSSVIIFMVNDHLGVGVAVAGAFTLVRFRSIAGNGKELIAIFASMAEGLILGMGYVGMAVLLFVVVSLVILVLSATGFGEKDLSRSLRILIPEDLDYDNIFDAILKKYTKQYQLTRVRTRNMGTLYELTYQISLRDTGHTKDFLDELRIRNGNLNVILSTYTEHDTI